MRQLTTWTARGSWADWRIRAVGSSYDMRMTTGHKGSLVGGSCREDRLCRQKRSARIWVEDGGSDGG